MTARVLVVDDSPVNVKLLEAKLEAAYFEVLTAFNGEQCLERTDAELPDIVLLDVMMPGMDGFEACRRIKANPKTTHIPVVMVTALDQPSDRVTGLNAGADDFLTKPVDDVALFARVRNLVRLKQMTEELRMREETSQNMGQPDTGMDLIEADPSGRIMVADDRPESIAWFRAALEPKNTLTAVSNLNEAIATARGGEFDLLIVSLGVRAFDGLRLTSQLRSMPVTRGTPILVVVSDGDTKRLLQAIEMGVNDYLMRPVDRNELLVRVRTQLRKKMYSDRLRLNIQLSREMAVTDPLTGLYNRGYMTHHLDTLMRAASPNKPISFLIMDIDFFKSVNDKHGHDIGDEVLREFASRVSANVRGIDLACRYGGEEFVVAMPDTDSAYAMQIAERLRRNVEAEAFPISRAPGTLSITVSIGIANSVGGSDSAEKLLYRADQALYRAKREGRNRVIAEAA